MSKYVWKFGLIASAVLVVFTSVLVPLGLNGTLKLTTNVAFGYSMMVLAFVMVFFGIRSYREEIGRGTISFGRAFGVGILITLVACAAYVASWEIVYFNFFPDYAENYAAQTLATMRAEGATEAALEEARQQNQKFLELYANPVFNVGMTLMEVFPVGLIVTLVSAGILRRRVAPA